MRILILGGDGMLGHQLLRHFMGSHDVRVTLRLGREAYGAYGLFEPGIACYGVDVKHMDALVQVMAEFRPEAVLNAVGVIKQRSEAKAVISSLEINSLLPHRLALLCRTIGARLIHFSTDCVFSGRRGNYREADQPDAEDIYGRTKLLGEISEPHCLTLRTSMVGPELSRKTGLLEWFLAQRGRTVKGFAKAIFSGFPTSELARIVGLVLTDVPAIHGLYHVAALPISKYDLLTLVRDRLQVPVTIERDMAFECDRSLDASRFHRDTGYSPPAWDAMIDDMARHMTERVA
ncbi:dTDP-4-dehydrorhamnose reductase family protein [Candidatus Nitrospira nitrificans]|uniref:dTDP-4-dehydrorhamnose reductase n=1 Tax=Candidatus Nitrospira nitrificans TaxID=1742973 RepID=A0A0S4LJN0_9BACT|nr:SDR family oxidoreductase [Candidatus Nitrospira nitrificans]CUS36123.1 dTDP-4-dehydrorhamnose reductase [Candidatus Nitrospira nitrificans]